MNYNNSIIYVHSEIKSLGILKYRKGKVKYHMRNKIIAILLSAIMVISLSACGGTETSNNDSNKEVEDLENQIAELQKQLEEVQQGNNDNDSDSNNTSSASLSINESTAETWGVCGADLTWYYENGTLVIRGTGEMTDFSRNDDQPWADIRNNLQWVYIEDGVTSIGERAFGNCKYLSKIEISNSVVSIGKYAFDNCSDLQSITIADNVIIGYGAFSDCSSLKSISLGENVSIGEHAFYNCDSLKDVIIPDNVTIGDEAFLDCDSLASVTIHNNVTIGEYVFSYCAFENIIISGNVSTIGVGMFSDCRNLVSVSIESGVTAIEERAFHNCTNLKSVTIAESVTTIESYAFSHDVTYGVNNGEVTIPGYLDNEDRVITILNPNVVTDISYDTFGFSTKVIIGGVEYIMEDARTVILRKESEEG